MNPNILSVIHKDITKVDGLLRRYETEMEGLDEGIFALDGKKIEQVCKDQPYHSAKFNRKRNELLVIEDFVKMQRDVIESKHWKAYNEGYSRSLSSTDIQKYVKGEPDYVVLTQIYLDVVWVRKRYDGTVKALEDLGYALNNITKLRISDLEHAIM